MHRLKHGREKQLCIKPVAELIDATYHFLHFWFQIGIITDIHSQITKSMKYKDYFRSRERPQAPKPGQAGLRLLQTVCVGGESVSVCACLFVYSCQ